MIGLTDQNISPLGKHGHDHLFKPNGLTDNTSRMNETPDLVCDDPKLKGTGETEIYHYLPNEN